MAEADQRTSPAPARQAITYTALGALPRALGFLLLPVYTRALGAGDYGRMSIAMAIFSIAVFLMSSGLEISVFRSWFELRSDPDRQEAFVQSAWRFLIVFPLATALVLGLAAMMVGGFVDLTGEQIALALLASAAQTASTVVPTAVARAREDLRRYVWLSLTSTIPTVATSILFVVVLDLGVTGWVAAIAIGQTISLGFAFAIVPWKRSKFDWPLVRMGITFGLPTVPHQAAAWALNLADRLVLAGIVSSAALGVYSLGANLAIPVMVAVMSLGQSMMPSWSRAGSGEISSVRLERLVAGQVAAIAVIAGAVGLMASPLVALMSPPSFAAAAEVVGWIALGYGFLGLYYIPAGCINLATGRNRLIWLGSTIGAGVNIVLLFVIVPSGGIRAAAIASAVGYAVLLLCTSAYWLVVRGDSTIRIPWRSVIPPVIVVAAIWVATDLMLPLTGAAGFSSRLGACLLLVAGATATGAFGPARDVLVGLQARISRA